MMQKLLLQLEEIENLRQFSDKTSTEVSEANVGWHLEHSLIIISRILEGLKKSNPNEFKPHFSFPKLIVMTTGYIPRKKAKAPKFTIPSGGEIIQNIENLIVDIKKNLPEVENLNANSFVEHPLFGHLNLKQTLKFLYIHTHHHLKIVKDILK